MNSAVEFQLFHAITFDLKLAQGACRNAKSEKFTFAKGLGTAPRGDHTAHPSGKMLLSINFSTDSPMHLTFTAVALYWSLSRCCITPLVHYRPLLHNNA